MKVSRLLPLIGIVIFAYLLLQVNLPAIASTIVRMSLLFFGLAIIVNVADIMLKALKWQMIFTSYNVPVPYIRFLKAWIVGLSLSLITPGKVGDFAKAYYFRDAAPLGKSLTTIMTDRIIDLLTLFILAIIGISIFATYYSQNTTLLLTTYILFAAFILAIFLFSRKRISTALLRPFYCRIAPKKHRERMKSIYTDFYIGIDLIFDKKKIIFAVIMLTFIVWLGSSLVIYLLALSINLPISYTFVMIIFPIFTLLEALPISFSGVGTRDATLIFFLSFIAIGPEASISLSLVYLITIYIFASVGFIIWFRNPINIKKTDSA